ncbi:MAG: CDC48 family AAA ATPase [Candidatus Methanoplasma sp.]|jgi:transitional endoplasmic reticulum ATPase|nr:CDC48 family AAA ATPase [Candidatus Methanoplasma sp.]
MGVLRLRVEMAKRLAEAGCGRVRIDEQSRKALGLEVGDAVLIRGKKEIVARVYRGEPGDKSAIRIDGPTRAEAGVSVGGFVEVAKCASMPAERVVLVPRFQDRNGASDAQMANAVKRSLDGRVVVEGMDVPVQSPMLGAEFLMFGVVSTDPGGAVSVSESTAIHVTDRDKAESIPKGGDLRRNMVTYDSIGGLGAEIKHIREMIELPLKRPELFEHMGITPPKGVLLYGPPGTGKTLIAEAIASESGAKLFSIRGPEIVSKYYGDSEKKLREVFMKAEANTPSVVFIDEIDSITPNRDGAHEHDVRLVAQLLSLMDGMGRSRVVVIGATNREEYIDPALRRPGRFDREIEIGVPGKTGRREILAIHTRGMPLAGDVDLDKIAGATQGFVGADLAALAKEAAMKRLARAMSDDENLSPEAISSMTVSMSDFTGALAGMEPSGMREVSAEIPKVTWGDIGGMGEVKRVLEEFFLPSEDGKAFERMGIRPGKGVLLYGPPGTGKTMIAKAAANAAGSNFISVSGPEILSKWAGESGKAVRKLFRKARQMAPCIIFFDEIDSIARKRDGAEGRSMDSLVAQLLVMMDGVSPIEKVTVMAATNRPEIVDPALLRPGRIDRMILVGKPDRAARLSILEVHAGRMPLNDGVDLGAVADATDGYVGADLEALCMEAGMIAYREGDISVWQRHFDAALETVGPSVDEATFEEYAKMGREMRKRRKSAWDGSQLYG